MKKEIQNNEHNYYHKNRPVQAHLAGIDNFILSQFNLKHIK
jgi:hypothetical protein